jgi:hypothetical protein
MDVATGNLSMFSPRGGGGGQATQGDLTIALLWSCPMGGEFDIENRDMGGQI